MSPSPAPPRPAALVQRDIDAWMDQPEAVRRCLDPQGLVLPELWAEWVRAWQAERAGRCGLAA